MRFIDKSQEDLANILSADLQRPVLLDDVSAALIDWIEFKSRCLPDEKWTVRKSKEILLSPFSSQFSAGLRIIEENFRTGRSNRAHQSKSTDTTEYHDLLFNDWGMHHFHLSDQYDGAFCKRTGPVLFVYFENDSAYFLDILEHGRKNPDVWADEHLVSVVDNNWPEVSLRYQLNGIDLQHSYTANERIALRRSGITSLIKANGQIFVPFGLGLNTATGSTRFSIKAMRILKHLNKEIRRIFDDGDYTYPDGSQLSSVVSKPIRFGVTSAVLRLRFNNGRLELYEYKSDQVLLYLSKIVG